MPKVIVWQEAAKRELAAAPGDNLLKVLHKHGYALSSPCGGLGLCGKCRIKIIDRETGEDYYQLACTTKIESDLEIEIPALHSQDAQIITRGDFTQALNPAVIKTAVILQTPDLEHQLSDAKQIEAYGLIPNALLPGLPDILRANDFNVTIARYGNTILAVEPGNTQTHNYGIAIDLGTTTLVGYLLDLNTGKQMNIYSSLNPQAKFGADVISRIDQTLKPDGLKQLTDLIRAEVNHMINYFCSQQKISRENIYQIVFVGNPVMLHLVAGLPVKNIALAPFIPVVCRQVEYTAADLGIQVCTQGKVILFPLISAYVGADTIAAVLASGMHQDRRINLLIDIGTNGEIALGTADKLLVCSTAAGPAFEGARIECGSGGVVGAINRVYIGDSIGYTTIGAAPAQSICGSGIIDAVAQMLTIGLIDASGRMLTPEEVKAQYPAAIAAKVKLIHKQPALILKEGTGDSDPDLYITQKDIREVQLAKAAIAAGITILLTEMNITESDVQTLYLTGGFGNYMDMENALTMGLIPPAFKDKIRVLGNGAGIGAQMVLLSQEAHKEAELIKEKATYIELSAHKDFQDRFIDFLNFTRS